MMERPAPQVLWSWLAVLLAIALPLMGCIGWLLWLFWPTFLPLGAVGCGGVSLLLVVYLPLRRRRLRFSLVGGVLTVTGGVVFATTRWMRVDAVRQVTLLQGPLERRCGTAFLLVSATGGHLLIEGLEQEQAKEWCQRLAPI